eukprot:CAMPEP_0115868440 /NCGR_PEP_ID=MMETSP0287-20121206/21297_1 /TAXON_ID=412157 /ORGANISM="Chrysochromulina rotalis, Strain UIO044" /LENGTH=141 /DNA_ID=CAMNT_0003323101 /DNA_START=586 /DNA_END=1011 /DNA_ORIENTATION=+
MSSMLSIAHLPLPSACMPSRTSSLAARSAAALDMNHPRPSSPLAASIASVLPRFHLGASLADIPAAMPIAGRTLPGRSSHVPPLSPFHALAASRKNGLLSCCTKLSPAFLSSLAPSSVCVLTGSPSALSPRRTTSMAFGGA